VAAPRASSRFAIFAQAISSTSPEMVMSSRNPADVSFAIEATPPAAGVTRICCLPFFARYWGEMPGWLAIHCSS
jgi:hypothetical protein